MICPRGHTELRQVVRSDISVSICHVCGGEWLGRHELEALEASAVTDPAALRGTIEYLPRSIELRCPVCERRMLEFDYRASPLELGACPQGHGYWLDAGKEKLVKEAIRKRARDLHRAARAE